MSRLGYTTIFEGVEKHFSHRCKEINENEDSMKNTTQRALLKQPEAIHETAIQMLKFLLPAIAFEPEEHQNGPSMANTSDMTEATRMARARALDTLTSTASSMLKVVEKEAISREVEALLKGERSTRVREILQKVESSLANS